MKEIKISFEDIEKDLEKLGTLKFKEEKVFKDFKEVIDFANVRTCTKYVNGKFETIITDNSTRHSKNNRPQCPNSRSRGLADITRIVKHYFPNVSLKEIYDYSIHNFYISYCGDTRQDVCKFNCKDARPDLKSIRLSNRKNVIPIIK